MATSTIFFTSSASIPSYDNKKGEDENSIRDEFLFHIYDRCKVFLFLGPTTVSYVSVMTMRIIIWIIYLSMVIRIIPMMTIKGLFICGPSHCFIYLRPLSFIWGSFRCLDFYPLHLIPASHPFNIVNSFLIIIMMSAMIWSFFFSVHWFLQLENHLAFQRQKLLLPFYH